MKKISLGLAALIGGFGLLLAGIFLVNALFSVSGARAATITCNFIWPQQVVINGTAYSCDAGASRGYCNYTKAQQGIAECCNWYEGSGYSNCAPIGPAVCAENWSCGAWGECLIPICNTWPNCPTQQTRACADANSCGTTASKPVTSQSCAVTCTDSDSGQDYYTKGSTTGIDTWKQYKNGTENDYCSGNSVTEFYCYEPISGRPYINYSSFTCPEGCLDGACKKKSCAENWSCADWSLCNNSQQTRICTDANSCGTTVNKPAVNQTCSACVDSDNGNEHYTKGITIGNYPYYESFMAKTDYCRSVYADGHDPNWLQEYFCYTPSSGSPYITTGSYYCADGCADGACKKKDCAENWSCGTWSTCANNQQTRTCADANTCGTTANKPALSQSCVTACAESWSCEAWSACANSQQTRTCSDANNCGTAVSKPAITQSCSCQEVWTCADWSVCQNNQQTRSCTDANSCGTNVLKPLNTQICGTVCAENWSCDNWSTVCVDKKLTRACKDLNNCGTVISKPAIAQECAPAPQTIDTAIPTTPAALSAPSAPAVSATPATSAEALVPDNTAANIATPINTTVVLPIQLEFSNPQSGVFFGGVTAVSYVPGEALKFYYKYQNVTEKLVKIKVVRQLVNSKNKAVYSTQVFKTLKAGAALAVDVKQVVAKSLPAGVYTIKVKVHDAKNKIMDENSFPIELKKKFFVINEIPAAADIAWDAKVWSQIKSNVPLPTNLKLRFAYTNNTDQKHVVKMVRELLDENGKVLTTKTGRWIMTVGEKDQSTFIHRLSDNLPVGNYTLRIRAYDWTSKELLAENSAGFFIEERGQ